MNFPFFNNLEAWIQTGPDILRRTIDGTVRPLFVDYSNFRVGIQTTSPTKALHVSSTAQFDSDSIFANVTASSVTITSTANLNSALNVTGSSVFGGGAAITTINIGSYTPTITIDTNLDSVSAQVMQFIRIGSRVIVFGGWQMDATTAGSLAVARFSLPIASNFTLSNEQAGGSGSNNDGDGGNFAPDPTNDTVNFNIAPTLGTNRQYFGIFGYLIN